MRAFFRLSLLSGGRVERFRGGLILGLILAGLLPFSRTGRAEMDPVTASQLQIWDQNLNAIYQRALKALPPARQAALRQAQRAWLEFRDKSHAALLRVDRKQGATESQSGSRDLYELRCRYEQIREMLHAPSQVPDPAAALRAYDASLNEAYKQLLATLDDADKKLLRESQRAWIAFRDADAKLTAGPAGGVTYGTALTTKYRADQLLAARAGQSVVSPLVIFDPPEQPLASSRARVQAAPTAPAAAPVPTATPDPNAPDPFAAAR